MIIYEVNLDVKNETADAFKAWLPKHIEQMLQHDGFTHANYYHRLGAEENGDNAHHFFTVQYHLKNREALQHYFDHHAEAMRADGLQRFPDQFSAHRRILYHEQSFEAAA